jgi:hypothetical protein
VRQRARLDEYPATAAYQRAFTRRYRTPNGQNLRGGILISRADVAHLMLAARSNSRRQSGKRSASRTSRDDHPVKTKTVKALFGLASVYIPSIQCGWVYTSPLFLRISVRP